MVRATARIGSWRLGDDFSPPPTRGRPLRTRAIRDARASPATSACLAPLRARASLPAAQRVQGLAPAEIVVALVADRATRR